MRTKAWSSSVKVKRPYSLLRSRQVSASFAPPADLDLGPFQLVVRAGRRGVIVEVSQIDASTLRASFAPGVDRQAVRAAVEWTLLADLDLRPFYRQVARHPVMGTIIRDLKGVKPMRPSTLFEMIIVAITEQQISLAAARSIRSRIAERFGTRVGAHWVFPRPRTLANAAAGDLRACGLSRAKARYVQKFARSVVRKTIHLCSISTMPDATARETLLKIYGFGPWSADYVLVRGLARPDIVPFDDLGVRDAIGRFLGDGQRVSASTAEKLLSPFAPYRGLAAFYLLAYDRSSP